MWSRVWVHLGEEGNRARLALIGGYFAATAAVLVAPFNPMVKWEYGLAQAGELDKQGDEFGDNAAFAEKIDHYRRLLALVPRSERLAEISKNFAKPTPRTILKRLSAFTERFWR